MRRAKEQAIAELWNKYLFDRLDQQIAVSIRLDFSKKEGCYFQWSLKRPSIRWRSRWATVPVEGVTDLKSLLILLLTLRYVTAAAGALVSVNAAEAIHAEYAVEITLENCIDSHYSRTKT